MQGWLCHRRNKKDLLVEVIKGKQEALRREEEQKQMEEDSTTTFGFGVCNRTKDLLTKRLEQALGNLKRPLGQDDISPL